MAVPLTFDQLPEAVSKLREDITWIKQFLSQNENSALSPASNEKFLNLKGAAEFLGLAPQTVYGLISRKLIPYMKRQKRVYFSKAELIQWLESGRRLTREEIAISSRPQLIKKGNK